MKNSTTTLLAAATLFTLTLASQSAMATNEDSGSYALFNGNSQSVSELSLMKASYMHGANSQALDNSEKGFDSSYVGSDEVALATRTNHRADYASKQTLRSSLSHTNK